MSAIKERILGAITIMSEEDARKLWDIISNEFSDRSWDDIESVTPDAWDLKMLKEIDSDPDCHTFVSTADAMKELGL